MADDRRYVSQPVRTQRRWHAGFYTGQDEDVTERARRYAEAPHGWGGYEANLGVARGEVHQIAPAQNMRGRGPKGYRRSDARAQEILCEQLTDDPRIDASELEVEVREGRVALRGSVPDRWMKFAIEDLVERCLGTVEVDNQLRVHRSADPPSSDWPIGS